LQNCNNINPDFINTFPTPTSGIPVPPGVTQTNCFFDGEASLAVRRELSQGAVLTSLVGYDLTYNTLDNNRNPTSGTLAVIKQDFAGAGGDVQFVRSTADLRTYYEPISDIVGVLHLQGGNIFGWGAKDPVDGTNLRMLDHFQMGPQLVRGFAQAGIGPRDLTLYNYNGTPGDALGGSLYWGASVEFQTPLFFAPKDVGIKVAAFADAGSLWDYQGHTSWLPPLPHATGEVLTASDNSMFVNSSVGVGLLWASPFGPIRFDLAYPVTKQKFDRTQIFRFSGGASF
jgi:outer membrane protein insertion porin family